MKQLTLPVCILFFGSMALAQSTAFFPPEYERAWGRGSSSLLGGDATRTQIIVASPFAAGTTILGVRFRCVAGTADRAAFTADMEVECSSTATIPGAIDATFANNTGSDAVTVLPQQTVNIPANPANRGTGDMAEILFTTPFVFGTNGESNLNLDVKVFSRSAGASWSTDRAFASTSGRALTVGTGCGTSTVNSTSSNGTYVAGSTVNLTLTTTPNTIALWVPSIDQKEFVPGFNLPFPLANIGAAAGCDLLVNPAAGAFAFVTDAAGGAAATLNIPLTYSQNGLGNQWVMLVPPTASNPAGLETSANRSLWIGPEICAPLYQYSYSLSSATVATGTATTNSVPVFELIIQ